MPHQKIDGHALPVRDRKLYEGHTELSDLRCLCPIASDRQQQLHLTSSEPEKATAKFDGYKTSVSSVSDL